MPILFASVTLLFAILATIVLFKEHGADCIVAWLLASSVVFVNVGFWIFHVIHDANPVHYSADGIIVTSVGLLTASSTALIFHARTRKIPHESSAFPMMVSPSSSPLDSTSLYMRRLTTLAIVILGPAWLYFYLLGSVPLFVGLQAVMNEGLGGLGAMNTARLSRDPYASSGNYIPLQGLLQLLRNLGVPIVFTYALLLFRASISKRASAFVMVLAIVTSLAAGQRWPLLYLILAAIIAVGVTAERFPVKATTRYLSLAAVLGVSVSMLQGRTLTSLSDMASALKFGAFNLGERIFLDQVRVPTLSYGDSGDSLRGLLGESYFTSLKAYVPGLRASFPVTFYQTITGDSRGYTAPPDFYTEAHINFGILGVVVLTAAWTLVAISYDSRTVSSAPEDIAVRAGVGAVFAFSMFNGLIFSISIVIIVGIVRAAFWFASLENGVHGAVRHGRVMQRGHLHGAELGAV